MDLGSRALAMRSLEAQRQIDWGGMLSRATASDSVQRNPYLASPKQWISTVQVRDPPLSAFAFGLQQSVSLLQQFAPMGIILAHIFKAACQHLDCLTVQAVFMKQR